MDCVYFYDHLVIIQDPSCIESIISGRLPLKASGIECQTNGKAVEYICKLLSEALKDRVSLVCPVNIRVKGEDDLQAIGLKYIGQPTHAVLTKGPQSNTPAGNEFRSFWGEKSELRRIDGDLCECVAWNSGANVCMQIINYVLGKKLQLSSDLHKSKLWYHILPNRLDSFISLHRGSRKAKVVTASSLRLIRAMDRLRGLLRGLNDKLPLNITGILPLSSAFRDTAVFPPILSVPVADRSVYGAKQNSKERQYCTAKWIFENLHFPMFPLYVVIHLEQSGRWPNDLDAFRHMKRLLVIRIHELLSPKGIPSHVTVDSALDIFLDGLIFRVLISLSKELNLIQKLTDSQQVEKDIPSKQSSESDMIGLLSTEVVSTETVNWIRLHQSLPTLAGTLAGVSRTYPHVFPIACRLAKRWLSAHGYPVILCPYECELDGLRNSSDFFPQPEECSSALSSCWLKEDMTTSTNNGRMAEVTVELLVLYASKLCDSIALDSNECNLAVIGSPVAAFLRFLDLLAIHDWENVPLLVDLNEGFSDINKRRSALDSFNHTPRCNLPALVIYTPLDLTGIQWTEIGPSRTGLRELKTIAAQSRDLLRAMLVSGATIDDIMVIFRPVFKKTDIVLKVQENIINIRHLESLDRVLQRNHLIVHEASTDELPMELPSPGARYWPQSFCYDPLNWFIRLLQLRLGKYFEVLWDRHGGNWIVLRWRQDYYQKLNSSKPFQLIQSIFTVDLLDGLTQHTEADQLTDLLLVYDEKSFVRLLSAWAEKFIRPSIVFNQLTVEENTDRGNSEKRKHNSEDNIEMGMKKKMKTSGKSEKKRRRKRRYLLNDDVNILLNM
ncbi:unnamed protein product [Heterobilharzia americana]|nr:unnamed protein product [Heterobilharzia americana]